jgi:hypothetical protein
MIEFLLIALCWVGVYVGFRLLAAFFARHD